MQPEQPRGRSSIAPLAGRSADQSRGTAHLLAERYLQLVSNVGSAVVGGGLPILLGVSPLPASFPLIALAKGAPSLTLALGGGLLLLLALAVTITQRGKASAVSGQLGGRIARFLFSAALSALGSVAIGVLFGFNDLPSTLPLLNLIRTHPPLGIGLLTVLLALLILAPLFGWGGGSRSPNGEGPDRGGARRLFVATAVSSTSVLLFVSLLGTVVLRPSWCPTSICPPSPYFPGGVNDGTLEVFYTATQSTQFVIPGDSAQYALGANNLPQATGASRSDVPRTDPRFKPYRAVIGVRSLQRDTAAGLIIEQVVVVVDAVSAPATPLNVWSPGPPNDYSSNPYIASYRGEGAGARLVASSGHTPPTHTELRAGESDAIDVELTAQSPAAISFHLEVRYDVIGGAPLRTLAFTKHEFTLVFSDAANWHIYQLGPDGRFMPEQP
jgi:hypothetical protein